MIFDLLNISIATSVVILFFLLLSPLFGKRYGAGWRYIVWIGLAVRLLIPFQLALPAPPAQLPVPEDQIVYLKSFPQYLGNGDEIQTQQEMMENATILTSWDILFLIWLLGASIFFGYHLVSYAVFRRRIKPWCKPLQHSGGLPVAVCSKIAGPMLIEYKKPLILLPDIPYTPQELEAILAHETQHARRGDLWLKLLLTAANAVHWFNPFVYLMVRAANRELELSCDDLVTRGQSMDFRKFYSDTILKSIGNRCVTSLSTQFKGGKREIKKRFANILDERVKKRGGIALAAVLCVSVVISSFAACGKSGSIAVIGGSDGPTSIYVSGLEDRIGRLYQLKNTNVGNNSDVGAILSHLPQPGLRQDTFALFTDQQPYGVAVNYTAETEAAKTENPLPLYQIGAVFLALVDNAEFVELNVNDREGGRLYSARVTRQNACAFFQHSLTYPDMTADEKQFEQFVRDVTQFQASN